MTIHFHERGVTRGFHAAGPDGMAAYESRGITGVERLMRGPSKLGAGKARAVTGLVLG